MAPRSLIEAALALSPQDRLDLLERLWDSLQDEPDAVPISDREACALDRREDELERDPALGSSWEEVQARHPPR